LFSDLRQKHRRLYFFSRNTKERHRKKIADRCWVGLSAIPAKRLAHDGPKTRAEMFSRKAGWKEVGVKANGEIN